MYEPREGVRVCDTLCALAAQRNAPIFHCLSSTSDESECLIKKNYCNCNCDEENCEISSCQSD